MNPLSQILAALLLVFLTSCGGCASKPKQAPPPLVPEQARISVEHFAGSTLSGSRIVDLSSATAMQALAVRLRATALSSLPADQLEPLGMHARLIFAAQGGAPVLPSVRLTSNTRIGIGDAASGVEARASSGAPGTSATIGEVRTALPAGATAVFELDDRAASGASGTADRRKVMIHVARAATAATTAPTTDRVQIAVVLDDLAPLPVPRQSRELQAVTDDGKTKPKSQPAPVQRVLQREGAITDEIEVTRQTHIVLVIPFTMTGGTATVVMFGIDVAPGTADSDHQAALAAALEQIARSNDALAKIPTVGPGNPSQQSALQASLRTIKADDGSRRAMIYLADQTGAKLLADAALAGDEPLVRQLAGAISADAGIAGATDPATLGWLLDRVTLVLLTSLLNDSKLPAEMASVLSRYAGEAGRHAGSLEELLRTSGNRKDFDSRLIAENYIYLEDNAPSARVRAFDWLSSCNQAPAGFDPLAPVRQRRAAIEKALTTPATKPTATQPAVTQQ